MDQSQDYVIHSLEQHLFFARIMKEHALFLKLGFLPPNQNLAQDAEHFLREFEALLSRAIAFSNRVVRNCVLCSGELVTEFTDCAERQTQQLTGTAIDRKLTSRTIELVGCGSKADPPVSRALVRQVRQLNRDGIQLVDGLIAGSDIWDSPMPKIHTTKAANYENDAYIVTQMRNAMHHILYTVVNSNAMNGWSSTDTLKTITPWWQTAIYALIAVLAVLTILCAWQLSKALKAKKSMVDTAPAADQK